MLIRTLTTLGLGSLLSIALFAGRWQVSRIGEEGSLPRSLQIANKSEGYGAILDSVGQEIRLVLLALVLCLAVATVRDRRAPDPKEVGVVLLLIVYLMLSALWTVNFSVGAGKALEVAMVGVMFWGSCVCGSNVQSRNAFAVATFGFLCLVLLLGLRQFGNLSSERLSILGGGPNTYGRNIAILVGLLLVYGSSRSRPAIGILSLCAAGIGTIVVFATGSRGALLGLGGSAVIGCRSFIRARPRVFLIGISVLCLIAVVGLSVRPEFLELGMRAWERVGGRLWAKDGGVYLTGRDLVWGEAINMFVASPLFGCGLGSFSLRADKVGEMYPHNLFLEVGAEAGSLGLALLLWSFYVGFVALRRVALPFREVVLVLLVPALSSALVSGDVYDSRFVMVALGMAIGAAGAQKGAGV